MAPRAGRTQPLDLRLVRRIVDTGRMTDVKHKTQIIPVGRLLLDTDNPRHEPVESQREAIFALIASERHKLVVLANDIKEHGLSPIDRLLVMKSGRNHIVVEGNRRLAALRLLANPSLAEHTIISASMKRIARDAVVPRDAECSIVASRRDAEHWMELRHTGEASGAGTVRWNTFATNRFSHKPGSQAAKAISFLEAVAAAYPTNDVIQELSARIVEKRLTTLGRLVSDPNFKSRVGMVDEYGMIQFHYTAAALQQFMETVLGDIASDVSVSQLKSKSQRAEYLGATPKPDATIRLAEPKVLGTIQAEKAATKQKPRPKPSKPPKPLKDLRLDKLGAKTQALLREFHGIDPDKLPNTAVVVTRALLELAVDEYIRLRGLHSHRELRKRVETCLKSVDPSYKASEYQGLRTGLQDGSSLYAVATLHGFVHNPHYHAEGTTVRSIAANIEPFLWAMNDRV